MQFDPPKSPLRDAFLAQNTISSAQKAPTGCFSGSKHNLICPEGPCGMTLCYSQSELYDIGTEFLFYHCFATKIIKPIYESIIPEDSQSSRRVLAFYSIETWFKAPWDFFSKKRMRPWIRSLSNILPKRPLRDDILAQDTQPWYIGMIHRHVT